MKCPLWIYNVEPRTTIIITGDALAEVVVLAFSCRGCVAKVVATELEVDLVEIVGHKHSRRDHTRAVGDSGLNADSAKEDKEVSPQLRGIVSFGICELGAQGGKVDGGVVGDGPVARNRSLLCEVNAVCTCR